LPGLINVMPGRGVTPQPMPDPEGEVRWLTKGDTVLGQQVIALTKAVEREVQAGDLRRKPSWTPMIVVVGSMVLAGVLLLAQTVLGGDSDKSVMYGVLGLNIVPWVAIFAIGALAKRRPLTSKG